MTFAQLERETIVERVTDNYYFRANNGYWPGGYAPYGYKIKHIIGHDNKKHSILEIDENESKIVQQIFDMYTKQNMSMRKISQKLNMDKIPSKKRNGFWGINAINSILSRPIYTPATSKIYQYFNNLGANITNDINSFNSPNNMTANLYGKTQKNVKVKALRNYSDMYLSLTYCIPFISNDVWFKAQETKGDRKLLAPRTNTSKRTFLSGLVKCGKCGSNMITQGCTNRKGVHYIYLICSHKKNLGSSTCSNKMIDVSKLQDIVLDDMRGYFNSANIAKKIEMYLNNIKKQDTKIKEEKENIENEIIKLDIQIQNLINSIAEGNATISKYINLKIEEIEQTKQHLVEKLKSLNNNSTDSEDTLLKYIKNINEQLNSSDFEELKKLCNTIIDKIVVTDRNIDIYYKI